MSQWRITQGTKGTPTRSNTSPVSGASGPAGIASGQPPLPPEQLSALLAGRRDAANRFQTAQTAGREQSEGLRINADRSARDRTRQFDQITNQTMDQFGDRGMAFQPIGAGQGLRQIRDAEAHDSAGAEYTLAMQLAMIAEQVAEARRARDVDLGGLTETEQQWRSQLIRDELANFAF